MCETAKIFTEDKIRVLNETIDGNFNYLLGKLQKIKQKLKTKGALGDLV